MGRKKYEHDKINVKGKSDTNREKGKVIFPDVQGGKGEGRGGEVLLQIAVLAEIKYSV